MDDRRAPWLTAIGDEAGASLSVQVNALVRLGCSRIELRSIDRRALAQLSLAEVQGVAETLAAAGLAVSVLSSGIGAWGRSVTTPLSWDLEELRLLAPRAELLQARSIRVMSWQADAGASPARWAEEAIRRMRLLVERARSLGLTLLHENCLGWAGQDAECGLALVRACDSPSLRLLLDVGNCVVHGQDPVRYTRALVEHVAHVHVKDVLMVQAGPRFVPPGEGSAQIRACLAVLRDAGYEGGVSLEPHLHTRPHEQTVADGVHALEDFLACGRALARMLREVWSAPLTVAGSVAPAPARAPAASGPAPRVS